MIKKLILKNFKKFKYLELDLNESMNILVGDNEAGKSSLLLALDLVLSASRSKVEKYGLEGLMNIDTVKFFFDGERTIEDLPELSVEVFLSEQSNFETNGANNTKGIICDGLRFECRPIDNYHEQILDLIKKSDTNFPYEYYSVEFTTFSGDPYSPYKKHLKHIFIDSSLVNSDYATKEYVKSVYSVTAKTEEKYKLKNEYRQSKRDFVDNSLELINKPLSDYKFSLRFGEKHSIEENLIITDNDIPINYKGKGRQSFIKTEFALQKHSENDLDIVLLEEPENHLSHMNMKSLIEKIRQSTGKQLFIATHSSLVTSRLGLNSVQMIGQNGVVRSLSELPGNTPDFFTKAPNSNLLEFILSERVILVEGSAEFILMNAFYKKTKGSEINDSSIHVISVGGLSFKRYLDIAALLNIKVAIIKDNDGDYEKKCNEEYSKYLSSSINLFSEKNNVNKTFEVCLYNENQAICDNLFKEGRKTLSVLDYMLNNKADVALKLLKEDKGNLQPPNYIKEAIEWISS